MTYSALIGAKSNPRSLRYWINYSEIPAEDLVEDAQNFIFQSLRAFEMKRSAVLSLTAPSTYILLPDRFIAPIFLRGPNGRITNTNEDALMRRRIYQSNTPGIPLHYTIFNQALQFDRMVSVDTTLSFIMVQRPLPLGPTAEGTIIETNWLTERYSHILRAALLAHAYEFRTQKDRSEAYFAKTVSLIGRANVEADEVYRGADFPVEDS